MASQEKIKSNKELAILNGESLFHYKLIARSIGVDEDTLLRWRTDDTDFADRLEIARTAFIQKQMGKAKPEFLLERMEREVFAPPAQQVEHSGVNPIRVLLDAYEITTEGSDEPKADDAIQATSENQT